MNTRASCPETSAEDVLWSLLNTITDVMDRHAIPGPWLTMAYAAGSKFITDRRAALMEGPIVDMVPPATARDRWMYEQGRLAERDPRTRSGEPQAETPEPVDYLRDAGNGVHEFVGKFERGAFPVYRHPAALGAGTAAAPTDSMQWERYLPEPAHYVVVGVDELRDYSQIDPQVRDEIAIKELYTERQICIAIKQALQAGKPQDRAEGS